MKVKESLDLDTVQGRLMYVMDEEGNNRAQFARNLNISGAYMTNVFNDGRMPGTEVWVHFKKSFPNWNLDWVITGMGEKKIVFEKNAKQEQKPLEESDNKKLIDTVNKQSETISKQVDLSKELNNRIAELNHINSKQVEMLHSLLTGSNISSHHIEGKSQVERGHSVRSNKGNLIPEAAHH